MGARGGDGACGEAGGTRAGEGCLKVKRLNAEAQRKAGESAENGMRVVASAFLCGLACFSLRLCVEDFLEVWK
jgi:hypothetical protein